MSAPLPDDLTWLAARTPDGKVYYFHANSREVVWTLPDHVDPATVPLAVAPGSPEARHAEATGRLIQSPSYLRGSTTTSYSPSSSGFVPASATQTAGTSQSNNAAVTAVRTGKNALLFAGYLVRASAGWSTFTRRYCVVDPATGSLRCFANGPTMHALAAIFGSDHPAAESDEAAQSIAPVQGDLAASLAQGLLTDRNEKSAVPLKGARLRVEDIPGDVGAGQLNDTPVFTITTAAGRIHRFVVEEGNEAHEDWITHLEAAIVAASGAPPATAGAGGAASTPSKPPSSNAAGTGTGSSPQSEAQQQREADDAAERAAEAEDAANAAAEAAAASRGGAMGGMLTVAAPPPSNTHRGAPVLESIPEVPVDFATQPISSPPPRPQLSNEPDASGAPPSHGVDPAAISAAQALVRGPPDAPDTLVGWMHKSDPHGRNWKYRYFVLRGTVLSYYTDSRREQLKGSIILTGDTFVEASHGPDQMMGLGRRPRIEFRTEFPLYIGPPPQEHTGVPSPEQVSWAGRAYWMSCESHDEALDWAETLNTVVDAHRLLSGTHPSHQQYQHMQLQQEQE